MTTRPESQGGRALVRVCGRARAIYATEESSHPPQKGRMSDGSVVSARRGDARRAARRCMCSSSGLLTTPGSPGQRGRGFENLVDLSTNRFCYHAQEFFWRPICRIVAIIQILSAGFD